MTQEYSTKSEMSLAKTIIKNWFFVLFVGGVIIGWTTMKIQAENTAMNLSILSKEVTANKNENNEASIQLSAQLAQIQTDLQWIKTKLK